MVVPQLDIRTLSLVTVVFAIMYSLGLYLFGRTQPRFKGFGFLGTSSLFLGLGFMAIGYRQMVPDFFSIVIANTLIPASFTLAYQGITRLINIRRKYNFVTILPLVINLIGFIYLTYIHENLAARIVLVNASIIFISAFCVLAFLESIKPEIRTSIFMLLLGFLINAAYSLFRIIWTLSEQTEGSFMSAGMVHGLAFIIMDIYILGTAFGYIWLASRFLEIDLRAQARIDPLTKALNRRALEAEVEKERARFSRGGKAFSLIIFDLDYFKRLNDTYGHQAGDIVLVAVSNYVKSMLREQDVFARIGGEEFLIVLTATGKPAAMEVAERLRLGVEALEISSDSSEKLKITASFGVGTYHQDGESWQELVRNTDQALYQAKQGGRNRVIKASGDTRSESEKKV